MALPLGALVPRIGAPIIGLVLGMAVAGAAPATRIRAQLGLTSRYALQVAIVLLGATISLQEVVRVGGSSVPVMLVTLASALLAAAMLGRRLAVPERVRALIGVGTGICGASAIAAVSRPLEARDSEIRYAISTIFVFNLLAVIVFPIMGHALGMSQHTFGVWAGTAVNDASSVVAAGFAYGHHAASYALVVKLTRTTMIVPISIAILVASQRRRNAAATSQGTSGLSLGATVRDAMPWFLLWFLAASAADTLGLIGANAHVAISHLGLGLTTVALAAVGLASNFGEMRRAGARPLVLGALVWITVSVTSVALQLL